jgi:hypothetical protein
MPFGRRGAHITIGHGHVRSTVGLPGAGISYTATVGISRRRIKKHGSILLTLFVRFTPRLYGRRTLPWAWSADRP